MDTTDVFGVGLTEAMSTVISSLGNVGPGLGAFGPAFRGRRCPMLLMGIVVPYVDRAFGIVCCVVAFLFRILGKMIVLREN